MNKLTKSLVALFFLVVFIYVLMNVPYPHNLTSANIFQISSFFIPLFLMASFIISIFFVISFSFIIALGIIFLLLLQALDSLNPVSAVLILIVVWLFISYLKKNQKKKTKSMTGSNPMLTNLTSRINIPKLRSLSKSDDRSKLRAHGGKK